METASQEKLSENIDEMGAPGNQQGTPIIYITFITKLRYTSTNFNFNIQYQNFVLKKLD